MINGPLRLDLVYTEFKNRLSEVAVDFDLVNAVASVDFAKWKKPAGSPGHATIRMTLDNKHPVDISAFSFAAGDFSGRWQGALRSRWQADGSNIRSRDTGPDPAGCRIGALRRTAMGYSYRRRRLRCRTLHRQEQGTRFDAPPAIGQPPAPAEEDKPSRPYTISAERLASVMIGPGRAIENIGLKAAYDGLHWQ